MNNKINNKINSPNVYIVTVATESDFYYPYLVESCKRHNANLTVLGFGEKWKGFNWKYTKMLEYLKTKKNNDIICFVDGYDVICTRDVDDLGETFIKLKNKYDCKMIVSYDDSEFTLLNNIYFGKCDEILINSGLYIGFAKDLLEILDNVQKLNPDEIADDQTLLTQYCNLKPSNIQIDISNNLFLSLVRPIKELHDYVTIIDNNVIYNNKKPYFIHAPAGGYLDKLIIQLGYKHNYDDPTNNKLFQMNMLTILKKTLIC